MRTGPILRLAFATWLTSGGDLVFAQAAQENPPTDQIVTLSGATVLSGWKCDPGTITFRIDGGPPTIMASGTGRNDTAAVCGNAGLNGYGILYNVNLFGDGPHVAEFFDDGVKFAESTFEVVTTGPTFLTGVTSYPFVFDFPEPGKGVSLYWSEGTQNFQFAGYCEGSDCPLDTARWGTCSWHDVGTLPSHNDLGDWCPDGTFLVQLDLDQDGGIAATDDPVVGRARCCGPAGGDGRSWDGCTWETVGSAYSHDPGYLWCPVGRFLTQLDLDASGSAADSPIVGRARCCSVEGAAGWGQCYWTKIGPLLSHNDYFDWCQSGAFLTQLDLDADATISTADSPVVGHARCCRLGE